MKVSARVLTETSCNPFAEDLVCQVGRNPRPPTRTGHRRNFHDWQRDAFNSLFCKLYAVLNAPTGGGKSTVQKALAFVLARQGESTIIAVPETLIAGSFKAEFEDDGRLVEYVLPDGTVMAWDLPPENLLFADPGSISEDGTIDRIVKFAESRRAKKRVKTGTILVCSHAALVLANRRLVERYGRRAWKGVNVFIDEAHRSKFGEKPTDEEWEDEESEEEHEDRCNKLGMLVEHFVRNAPGRLMMTTATMLRGDGATIIPASCLDQFTTYELPMHEYLDGLVHLKEIAFKFSMADTYEEALRREVERSPFARTLVYQPVVKSGEGSVAKLQRLAGYQNVLGPSRPTGDGFSRTHTFRAEESLGVYWRELGVGRTDDHREPVEVISVDLVTVEGRDAIREGFERNKRVPHYIIVQNLFRMGADWRLAERSLVFGARSSLPMLIQMLGRLLRDYEGKARVEFHIMLPRNITADFDQFETYTGTIFTVMALGWLFQTTSLNIAPRLRSQRVIGKLISKCHATAMRGTNGVPAGEAMREILREAIGEADVKDTDLEEATTSLSSCLKGAFRMAANAVRHLLTSEAASNLAAVIEEDPFNAAGLLYETQWGADQFRAFRTAYNGLPEVTPEYVARVVFLHRCKFFQTQGQYVDPRAIEGAIELFGSAEALDQACSTEGL